MFKVAMKINWKHGLCLIAIAGGLIAFAGTTWPGLAHMKLFGTEAEDSHNPRQIASIAEGPVYACEITVGPFDIHRKYRSMEGPWAVTKFNIGQLVDSGSGYLPERQIHYVELERGEAPAMNNASGSNGKEYLAPVGEDLCGLSGSVNDKRTLYWFKGLKVEVLDENGNVMPTAEFICHTNLDFSAADHNAAFSEGERWINDRLITITQGQTNIMFPAGFAVPVSSDEAFRVTFQAANRTTSANRKLKHRATFYFIKDSDLVYPLTALYARVPFAQVIVDRNYAEAKQEDLKRHPSCEVQAFAVNAPNNVTGGVNTDSQGRVISGHWVVPPGVHTYKSTINDLDSAFGQRDRNLRFAWTHIHPCCTEVSVTRCDGSSKQKMVTAHVKTKTNPGLELVDIELINPKQPVVFPKNGHYEVEGTYNNTLSVPLDSMISLGLYFEDTEFRRPTWSLPNSTADFCGVTCKKQTTVASYPLFDYDRDGPIIAGNKEVLLKTNYGNIKLVLDPAVAPCTATEIYRLMTEGAYQGTRFAAYEPGFLLQLAAAEDKFAGKPAMSEKLKKQLRRVPLEVNTFADVGQHHRYSLSMARQEKDDNSGTSSFCIMLAPAPHLNGKYTVVGHVSDDAQSAETIKKICQQWKSAVVLGAQRS